MKIASFDNPKPITGAGGTASAASGKAAAAEPESSTQVALSPAAVLAIEEAKADFDAEKVARIALAIREGRFQVNAEAIADRLIANAREVLAGPQH